jgi:hypothetical protein
MDVLESTPQQKEQPSLQNSIAKELEEHGRKRFGTIAERV